MAGGITLSMVAKLEAEPAGRQSLLDQVLKSLEEFSS